jgi:hypothetical protein
MSHRPTPSPNTAKLDEKPPPEHNPNAVQVSTSTNNYIFHQPPQALARVLPQESPRQSKLQDLSHLSHPVSPSLSLPALAPSLPPTLSHQQSALQEFLALQEFPALELEWGLARVRQVRVVLAREAEEEERGVRVLRLEEVGVKQWCAQEIGTDPIRWV